MRMKSVSRLLIGLGTAAAAALVASATATAEPSGFPDLSTFNETPADNYIKVLPRGGKTISFSTVEGLNCRFGAREQGPDEDRGLSCDGPMPGLEGIPVYGSEQGQCDYGNISRAGGAYGITHTKQKCLGAHPAGNILAPGQKISYGNVTCAAGADKLLACVNRADGEHGFVLSTAGSWSF